MDTFIDKAREASAIEEMTPEAFPAPLRELLQPPEKLWCRGAWPRAGTYTLAVVGSRALSPYGRDACAYLVRGLAGYPISILSGLAIGADASAHRAALDAGLHTIAIPGSGLANDALYPRSNYGLAMDILDAGGLLLSEHPPDHKAHPYDFPSRNRLMVGLAHAVLIIEAGRDSGTLITARLAGEYNRHLLCVPHRIGDAHGHAAHIFLRIGATHVTEPLHLLEALGIAPREEGLALDGRALLEGPELLLYDLLRKPLPQDALIRASGLAPGMALTILAGLEMRGLIIARFGAWRQA